MEEGVVGRIIGRGIADLRFIDHHILLEKEADLPLRIPFILNDDPLDIYGLPLVDAVIDR
ncbi:hypothetical protein D3C76_1777190 [compost metagenome]